MLHKPIILFQAGKLLNLSDNSYRLFLLVFSYGYVCPNLGETTVLINIQPSSYVHISFFFFFFILDKTYTFLFLFKCDDSPSMSTCRSSFGFLVMLFGVVTASILVHSPHLLFSCGVITANSSTVHTCCFRVELSLPVYSSTVHTCCFRVVGVG